MRRSLAFLLLLGCGGDPRPAVDSGVGDDDPGDDDPGDGGGDDGTGDQESGDDDVAEYVSGTRIRRRMGTTPDGAKMFVGWRDTMLDIDCNFSYTPDGVLRCVPASSAFVGSYFADSLCTMELAAITCAGVAAPRYAVKFTVISCGERPYSYSVYEVSAPYAGPLFITSGTQCMAVQSPAPAYSFFRIGAPLSPSTFQSMTESVE